MRRGILSLVAGLAVLVTAGGVYVTVSPDGGEEEVLSQAEVGTPLACAPSDLPSPAPTPVKGEPFVDPEAGLSDSERMALHERLRTEGEAQYRAWLACLDISKLDLRSLSRGEIASFYLSGGKPSLPEAVASADLVVAGTVTAIEPTPFSGTDTTFSVDQTLKGPSAPSVIFTQEGGFQPTQDWMGVVIGEGAAAPFLLPGDRAVLFLQKTEAAGEATGEYYIQSFSGWYQVVDGRVQANALNSWGTAFNGTPEAQFMELVEATAGTISSR